MPLYKLIPFFLPVDIRQPLLHNMPLLRRRPREGPLLMRRRQRTTSFRFSNSGTLEPVVPAVQPTTKINPYVAVDDDMDDALVAKLGEGARSPCVNVNATRAAQNKLYPLAFIRLLQAQARRKIHDEEDEQPGLEKYFDDDSSRDINAEQPLRKRWKRTLSIHRTFSIQSPR